MVNSKYYFINQDKKIFRKKKNKIKENFNPLQEILGKSDDITGDYLIEKDGKPFMQDKDKGTGMGFRIRSDGWGAHISDQPGDKKMADRWVTMGFHVPQSQADVDKINNEKAPSGGPKSFTLKPGDMLMATEFGTLHFEGVEEKCNQPRDKGSVAFIKMVSNPHMIFGDPNDPKVRRKASNPIKFDSNKFTCIIKDGPNLVANIYNSKDNLQETVKLIKRADKKDPVAILKEKAGGFSNKILIALVIFLFIYFYKSK